MPKRATSTTFHAQRLRTRYHKNPRAAREASHWRRVKAKYGISPGEYEAILKHQGNKCAICDRPVESFDRRLATDHVHDRALIAKYGLRASVRGLLCWRDNYWVVRRGVTSDILRRAAAYLERWPAREVLLDLKEVPLHVSSARLTDAPSVEPALASEKPDDA